MNNAKLQLRQQVLKILLSKYGSSTDSRAVYECADDWCNKQVTSSGVLNYFEAYKKSYETKGNHQVGEEGTQTS
tara:strand:+ start:1504 stop:1725 length:222 start_codon:yes stop_codon:yes gene_type:complete